MNSKCTMLKLVGSTGSTRRTYELERLYVMRMILSLNYGMEEPEWSLHTFSLKAEKSPQGRSVLHETKKPPRQHKIRRGQPT